MDVEKRSCYLDGCITSDVCLEPTPLHIFQTYMERDVCYPKDYEKAAPPRPTAPWSTLRDSLGVVPVILTTLLGFALSQLLCQHMPVHSTRRFFFEFLLTAFPTVLSNSVASEYNELLCAVMAAVVVLLLWSSGIWARLRVAALSHCFEISKRPSVITVLRGIAYISTGCAILAVDFKAFPLAWRKNYYYGASLMDVGIGIFVLTMGLVSGRTKSFSEMRRVLKTVLPLLVLGLTRTVVITLINYHQDEHEYGTHLNAFFTLGFTKLIGSLCCLLIRSEKRLLPLSLAILALHQTLLSLGLESYVMSNAARDSFLSANREGLSALPGCVALYLLNMWGGYWYRSQNKLSYAQFLAKLRYIVIGVVVTWLLVAVCNYHFGIARVTFNAGYVFWIFGLGTLVMLIVSFLFEFCLIVPQAHAGDQTDKKPSPLPVFAEILNMNGLTHFLISNLLTGFVNMALAPGKRSDVEAVIILMLYMLASCGFVFVLFRRGKRIA